MLFRSHSQHASQTRAPFLFTVSSSEMSKSPNLEATLVRQMSYRNAAPCSEAVLRREALRGMATDVIPTVTPRRAVDGWSRCYRVTQAVHRRCAGLLRPSSHRRREPRSSIERWSVSHSHMLRVESRQTRIRSGVRAADTTSKNLQEVDDGS